MKTRLRAFTLVELLVVIAIVGILASFLLPVLGKVRVEAKKALTVGMLNNLQVAIADYHRDTGVYPPERGIGEIDNCAECLYFSLVGSDIDTPSSVAVRNTMRKARMFAKVYFDFKKEYLANYDKDKNWEAIDAFGNPWIYVRGSFPNKPNTAYQGIGEPLSGGGSKPFHHRSAYDLYSVGPDGKTGLSWPANVDLKVNPGSTSSFYKNAANAKECGDSMFRGSADDIANF